MRMSALSRAGLLLVLLAAGAGATPHRFAGGERLYVTNQDDGTVSVVDLATNKLIETIDFKARGYGPNPKPHHAQVEPDGSFWYLTLIGAGKVLKLDRDNKVVGSVDSEVPGLLALHPTKDLILFARSMSAVNPPSRIGVIRRSDMKLLDEFDVFFPRPHGIVIDPRGDYAYVASLGVNKLVSVRLEDGQLELIDIEGPVHTLTQLSVSPDAKWAVATGSTSNNLLLFDIANPAKPKFVKTVPSERGPFESQFTYDGRWLFVSNLDANVVSVVDPNTWQTVATIKGDGFNQPHGVALSPDGRYVYVSNRHQGGGAHDHEGHKATGTGTLVAICIPTRAVDTVLSVGHYAAGVGVPIPRSAPKTPAACR